MLVSAFAFSVMSALVKALGARLPSVEIALVRAVLTLGFSLWQVRRAGVSPFGKDRGWLVVRGLLGFVGLHSYFYAITALPLADATILHFSNPLWVALFAPLALGEPRNARDVSATLLGLAGVTLVARPAWLVGASAAPLAPLGVLAALVGALAASGAYLVVRRLRDEHPLVVVLQFPLLGVPLTLPLALPVWIWPTPLEWALLAAMAVATQIGQLKMTEALGLESAARATALSYAQVPFAMLFGLVCFGDVPAWTGLAGTALITLATALVARAPEPRAVDPARPG